MPLTLDTDTSISNLGNAGLLNLIGNVEGIGPLRIAAGRTIVGNSGIVQPSNGTAVEPGGELWVGDQTFFNVTTPVTVLSGGAVTLTPNARVNAPLRLAGPGPSFSRSGALHVERSSLSGGTANAQWNGLITLDAAATIATRDGTLTLNGGLNLNGNALTSGNPLDGAGIVLVQSNSVSGTGPVTVNGGRLEIMTASTFTGSVVVRSNGLLQINSDTGLGSGANSVFLNDGTLNLLNSPTVSASRSITLEAGNGTLNGNGTVNSVIGGPGKLKKSNGFMTLNAANTYGGGTEITDAGAGFIILANAALGAPGTAVTLNGGSLSLNGNFNLDPTRPVLVNGNGGRIEFKFDSPIGSTISGPGKLTIGRRSDASGQPVITLTGTTTQNGLAISETIVPASSATNLGDPAGILELASSGTRRGRLTLLAPFDLGPLGTNIYNGDIDTAGHAMTISRTGTWTSLGKLGNGILTLAASNNLLVSANLSDVRVLGGVLRVGAAGAIPSGGSLRLLNGAQLDLNGFNHAFREIVNGAGSVQMGGATLEIQFVGGLLEQGLIGPGTLLLRACNVSMLGACSHTNLIIGTADNDSSVARLYVESAAGLGAPGTPITLRRGGRLGTIFTNAPIVIVIDPTHPVTIDNGGGFEPETGLAVESVVSGFGGLTVQGGGTLELRNPLNTFTGPISVINSGTLRV